jgi:hypothetical protein
MEQSWGVGADRGKKPRHYLHGLDAFSRITCGREGIVRPWLKYVPKWDTVSVTGGDPLTGSY